MLARQLPIELARRDQQRGGDGCRLQKRSSARLHAVDKGLERRAALEVLDGTVAHGSCCLLAGRPKDAMFMTTTSSIQLISPLTKEIRVSVS